MSASAFLSSRNEERKSSARPFFLISLILFFIAAAQAVASEHPATFLEKHPTKPQPERWRGVHLFVQSKEAADALAENMSRLAAIGVNVVVAEVNYSFDFKSHPELRNKHFITRAEARRIARAARRNGIRVIPELDCLGHQSWSHTNLPMLAKHPEFMEPIDDATDPKGAHLHSWCPRNPEVTRIACDLLDELADAFQSDAVHVGMDEVFCLASKKCPRCANSTSAESFAKAVNDLHHHIVDQRHEQMLMWGDRLLNARAMGYSKWEASQNGTWGAADLIPKDIIVCDWHYEKQTNYPSIPYLLNKGFRVWPSGWQPLEAAQALSHFSLQQKNPRLIGYLGTAWSRASPRTAASWPPFVEVLKEWKN